MKLNRRELGTILAALRYWQESIGQEGIEPKRDFMTIATDCDELDPLTQEEIDELCEKLNQ